MSKIYVTGARGHVGRYLVQYPDVVELDVDVRNKDAVDFEIRRNCSPGDVVVHLASKSNVDFCERRENEKLVSDVNVRGTFNVALATERYSCGMVLLSSDHIFDGKFNWNGYKENTTPSPINFYGTTKVAAEGIALEAFGHPKIVRTSFLFDENRLERKLVNLLNGHKEGHPTFIKRSFMYIPLFVDGLLRYVDNYEKMPKILHISGNRIVGWYDFMIELAKRYKLDVDLVLARRMDIKSETQRPRNGGLNVSLSKKLGLPQSNFYTGIEQMYWDRQK
jgi:dTDP-4-dehydrorhamnose reductase